MPLRPSQLLKKKLKKKIDAEILDLLIHRVKITLIDIVHKTWQTGTSQLIFLLYTFQSHQKFLSFLEHTVLFIKLNRQERNEFSLEKIFNVLKNLNDYK